MTSNFKDCSTEQGRLDLMATPIKATFSAVHYPHISLTVEDWGVNAVLWLAVDDFVLLGIDSNSLKESLMMVAYLQQSTDTPLLIDKKLQAELTALSQEGFNPMARENGAIIPLNEVLSTDPDKETAKHFEQMNLSKNAEPLN